MQLTATAAPTWFRSSAEIARYREEKARRYAAYFAAVQAERAALDAGRWVEYHAASEQANRLWNAYCAHIDRGVR